MAWLASQIFAIPRSQIETEWILNVVGVFASLWRCQLEVENVDSLVVIYKNWPNDARVGCNLANDTKSFATEVDLLESHEVGMFEEE